MTSAVRTDWGCSVSRKRKISCGLGLIGEHGSKWEDFAPTDRSYAVADALLISCDKSYTARDISVAFPKNGLILSGKRPRTVSNVGLTRVWSNLTANRRRSEAWGVWRMRRSLGIVATISGLGSISAFGFITALLTPEAPGTKVLGTNGSSVVGEFTDGTTTQGFIDTAGNLTVLDVPGASATEVFGIDSTGDVVGVFTDATGTYGFLDTGGTFATLAPLGASYTEALGMNGGGQIVGSFADQNGSHGFVDVGGSFTTLNAPGASGGTQALGINSIGQIAGAFIDSGGTTHGFIDSGGSFTTIDVPGAVATMATDINASGQIAGIYYDSQGTLHGFIDNTGSFTTVDVPGASGTEPFSIDDSGQLVGFFGDATGNHGFVEDGGGFTVLDVTDPPGAVSVAATVLTPVTPVPEPSSLPLLGAGLIGLLALRRQRVCTDAGADSQADAPKRRLLCLAKRLPRSRP